MSHDLHDFFYPKSAAIIGATDKPGKPARAILENLSLFKGAVYPVNPKHETLLGHRCYPSLAAIPGGIDVAIIALPAPLVLQEIEHLHEKGVRRAIIISSGFAEAGDAGVQIQQQIAGATKRYGIRVVGPNALGMYNTENGFDSFFVSRERVSRPLPGRLSVVSQSGAITVILMEAFTRDGIGIAKAVNYGNRIDIDDADALDYLCEDPRTAAVAMYMESVGDGRKFLRAAKAFADKKPLVIWKAGKHELGAAAVASHTATLAGTYGLYQAAFRQAGVIETSGFEHVIDAAEAVALTDYSCLGNRLLVVTNGGGMAVAASDQAQKEGFLMPRLPEEARTKLEAVFPPFFIKNNPVDLTGSAKNEDFRTALKEALPFFDAALVIVLMGSTTVTEEATTMIAEVYHEIKKPIACCILQGIGYTEEAKQTLFKQGIPAYPSPERAVRALAALRNAVRRKNRCP
ncbi:MAG TPA: CoA-binding protein [Nitrospirota bacterium]|nr:CoA-binding protein [Nitrospirota bacterium]